MKHRLLPAGLVLIALIAAGQSLHDGSELRIGPQRLMIWFVGLQAAACGIYYWAVHDVLRTRRPRRNEVWVVLAVAVAMRAIPFCGAMFLSSDLFRYLWDGRVQLGGVNPYAFVPASAALADLRDTAIYPHINRATYALTIYPPAAEIVFAAVASLSQSPRAMRLAMTGFEALAVIALWRTLRRRGQPAERLLIYAWNPLTAWEFAGNGHVDAVAIGFLAATLWAQASGRRALAGAMLAAATLTKFLPAVIAPALWRAWDWRMAAAGLLTVVALYACYLGAGWHILGFLSGYAGEEGLSDGSGIWALAGLGLFGGLPDWAGRAWLAAIAAGLLLATGRMMRHPPDNVARAASLLMTATMLALAPHYPWYYPWLAVPAVLAPLRAPIWLGSASILLYISPWGERFAWASLVFVPAAILFTIDVLTPQSSRMPRPVLPTGAADA